MKPAALLALVLVLGACGQRTDTTGQYNLAAPDGSPEAFIANEAAPAPDGPIPEAFHGRWGLVPEDCTSTRGDAKGLLTVSGDSLRFYESRATLAHLIGSWPEKLEAEFAFSGEGQEWSKTETLALTASSNTLVRTEDGVEYRYRRCPPQ